MQGLNWKKEDYVRLYKKDSVAWKNLPWQSKAIYVLLLRHFDQYGRFVLAGKSISSAIEIMTGIEADICESYFKPLVDAEFFKEIGKTVSTPEEILDPEFRLRESSQGKGAAV